MAQPKQQSDHNAEDAELKEYRAIRLRNEELMIKQVQSMHERLLLLEMSFKSSGRIAGIVGGFIGSITVAAIAAYLRK